MPREAHGPNGGVERLHAYGLLPPRCDSMHELWSVISTHPTMTLLLPSSVNTWAACSLPHSCGGAVQPWSQPAPRMRVGWLGVPPGIDAMTQSHDQFWLHAG